ncbi:hypothetical protein B0I73DRAFT_145657 [Yarrowia lipolytica]|nr:hypothetical protein BKA91DRAFT_147025 [Yarrowia lipolytica]KAE8172838.1 hypothetical protein BKA90DRAFT_146293 [Yarrowia lipolytica]KAJ8055825.1 hypothetical protein LXG23DRAFT_57355 [Yarrowia lipolytica]RDW41264.1 hypothetical protein B0I73DRAFT_145657 [Yarrowia lipolytica]
MRVSPRITEPDKQNNVEPRTVGISPQSFENGDKRIQAKVDDQFEPANEARERPLSDLITDLLNRLDISCNCGGSYSIVETSKQFCGARSPQERLTALLTWFSLTWNRMHNSDYPSSSF